MRRDRLIRQALRERFVVTLTSGETFDGLLLDTDDKTVHLVDAHALDGSTRVSIDGALFLPRDRVAYMQRPEAKA
jgi:hypothetical protein